MYKRYILLFTAFLFLFPGAGFTGKKPDKQVQVIILHTNDMHSKIDNLGKLAYLADSLRDIFPCVFLVSAGDNFTGNPVVDIISDKGYPMIDLMNACGFDVSAIGNHEFDMGQQFLAKRIKQADFPFICANCDFTGSPLKQPPPFILLKAGKGIRLPLLGLIQLGDKGIPDTHPMKLEGLKFTYPLLTAEEHRNLKEKNDMLIGLTHLGVGTDKELAGKMPAFDLIIGGHSHTLLDTAILENGVMIVQAGWGLKYAGKTTLTVTNGKISERRYELICLDSLRKSDPEVQSLIDKYNDNPELKKVVGIAAEDIVGFDGLGSLITDAQRTEMKADFAFMNRRGIRIPSLKKGDITLKDVYQMDPFQNDMVVIRMTLKEIESLICYGYRINECPDLAVSGMTYTIISDSTGKCISVEMKDPEGKPPDPSKEFKVAMNSYILSTYKFDHKDPGKSMGITSEEVLINYMKNAGKIDYSGVKRVFFRSVPGKSGY